MKIVDQTIPPELQAIYDSLISNNPTGEGGNLTARTRRAARKGKKWDRYIDSYWLEAALWMANRSGLPHGSSDYQKFTRDKIREMSMGIFDPDYWTELVRLPTLFSTSTATGGTETSPPPYGYRDANFLPQEATYPAGVAGVSPARTSGEIDGAQWNDGEWTWEYQRFILLKNKLLSQQPPIAWSTAGTIQVGASDRGSRPMFSLMMAHSFSDAGGSATFRLRPPVDPAISLYYRYRLPTSTPPYFHKANARYANIAVPRSMASPPAAPVQTLEICMGPRPMFGLGFNNNSAVNTSYTGTSRAWQLDPCAKLVPQSWQKYQVSVYEKSGCGLSNRSYEVYHPKFNDVSFAIQLAQAEVANFPAIELYQVPYLGTCGWPRMVGCPPAGQSTPCGPAGYAVGALNGYIYGAPADIMGSALYPSIDAPRVSILMPTCPNS